MKILSFLCIYGLFILGCTPPVEKSSTAANESKDIPYLKKMGDNTQLIVDGKPFIVLGGELGNSTFTSMKSMAPVWPAMKAMNLNTLLAPVYWELIEPQEGQFDFHLLDQLIAEARSHDLKLILLWFGSWKNSMSSHAPAWIKTNQQKYPRVKEDKGNSLEILSSFSQNNLDADMKAFAALMSHIRDIDNEAHTIIMIQPENEIGMLRSARDYHPLANELFLSRVPHELTNYLSAHRETLVPELREVWSTNGYKTEGPWEEIFGKGDHTDEIFMAWYYARFANKIIQAGKAIYPLPMFVNAALNAPGRTPGQYPSAGPLPHLMDIWKAGGPEIDFISPDFYNPDFKHWNNLYTRQGNPLFIPEHKFDNTVAAKAVYAIGHYEAIGFAPFSIESKTKPEEEELGKMYQLLAQLTPIITAHHGQNKIEGVLLDKDNPQDQFVLGDYQFTVRHSHTLGWEVEAQNEIWEPAGAIFIQTGDREYYIAGSGITATFKNVAEPNKITGILKNEEGHFEDNQWKIYRHLNGDQTHQGRHIRIFRAQHAIQRLELYNYE
jgi:beta-galactosidase GanA